MNIATLLTRACAMTPDAPALGEGNQTVATYSELLRRVRWRAQALTTCGVKPGDRVGIFAGNSTSYIEVMLAALWIGGVLLPINAKLARPELDVILEQAEPTVLFTDEHTEGVAEGHATQHLDDASLARGDVPHSDLAPATPFPSEWNDLAWLFFTSGTTGAPKGAMITHGNLFSMVQGYLTDVDQPPIGSALIHFAPLSHGSGIYLFPFLSCAGVSVCGETSRMTADDLLALITHWPDACLFAAPTIVRRMTETARARDLDTTNLRTIVYGGGPLYRDDMAAAAQTFGPVFAQIYGQGESPMTITAQSRTEFSAALARNDDAYLTTVGRPFIGTEVRIARDRENADRVSQDEGAVGEILVRSQTVVSGYWRRPDATAETFVNGWLRTGDLGSLDANGCLTLAGRSKETIISGGSNVYPIEVETVLIAHDDVEEAAVCGVRDAEWGERVIAFVSLASTAQTDTLVERLDAHCRDRIARFKCPKAYYVRPTLPKNNYGKIDKRALIGSLSGE